MSKAEFSCDLALTFNLMYVWMDGVCPHLVVTVVKEN